MNQSAPTDSNLSLDEESILGDPAVMIAQPYQLYVERTDAAKNIARYYAMSIEPTLFGDTCLVRRWGRIGGGGQKLVHHFEREDEAVELFLMLLRKKRSRGYNPRCNREQKLAPDLEQTFQRDRLRVLPIVDGEAEL